MEAKLGECEGAIRVIDLLSYSNSHLTVNSFWLRALKEKYITYLYAESEHFSSLEELTEASISGTRLHRGRLWKVVRELMFPCIVLSDKNTPLLVMGATGAQLFTITILEKLFPSRAKKWTVILHSEIEGIVRPVGVMKRLARIAIKRLAFAKHCKGVVLGQHILKNMKEQGVNTKNIYSIEHPLPCSSSNPFFNIKNRPVKVANIGLLRADTKDLALAGELAKDKRIDVAIIGRKGPGFFSQKRVSEYVVEGHYSNSWMREKLESIDALLLCPKEGSYKFTALGTITDSLLYGKPAVWVRHDALVAYETSPLAICSNTLDELINKLELWEAPRQEEVNAWKRAWNYSAKQKLYNLLAED